MSRKIKTNKPETEELEEAEEGELDPKEAKKRQREEAAEKRRIERKKDKAKRWSGMILLSIMMIVGFLMWISGEVKRGPLEENVSPVNNTKEAPRIIVR